MSRIACVACSGVSKHSSPAHLLMPVLGSVSILQDSSGPNACIAQHFFKLLAVFLRGGVAAFSTLIAWRGTSVGLSSYALSQLGKGLVLQSPTQQAFSTYITFIWRLPCKHTRLCHAYTGC